MTGSLNGRVVIVTGAGNGIGKQHALLFAREGAKVVVNDLGGSPRGEGADAGAAQTVVDQIRAEGGEAVANGSSVSEFATGQELVDLALETFGDLHVVVPNAGVLRHRHFPEMTEQDWDLVMGVHLKGTFSLCRAAAAYWKGRHDAGHPVDAAIVTTSSPQGLFGGRLFPEETASPFPPELAQANYDTAKAGILGLTLSLATELYRYGVRTNSIVPFATTRLAELYPGAEPLPPGFPGEDWIPMHPRINSQVVAWLATEACPANGTVWNPVLGSRWVTWSQAEAIPIRDGWMDVGEIDRLIREHIGVEPLAVLGTPSGAPTTIPGMT